MALRRAQPVNVGQRGQTTIPRPVPFHSPFGAPGSAPPASSVVAPTPVRSSQARANAGQRRPTHDAPHSLGIATRPHAGCIIGRADADARARRGGGLRHDPRRGAPAHRVAEHSCGADAETRCASLSRSRARLPSDDACSRRRGWHIPRACIRKQLRQRGGRWVRGCWYRRRAAARCIVPVRRLSGSLVDWPEAGEVAAVAWRSPWSRPTRDRRLQSGSRD